MRRWDANAIEHLGIPGRRLMENAAEAVVAKVQKLLQPDAAGSGVVVCCGAGNNGGDGFAVARLLKEKGLAVAVIALGEPDGADAKANHDAWREMGETLPFAQKHAEAETRLEGAGLIVDALFGTGLNRAVSGPAEALIEKMNAAPVPLKVAVDVPSGINSDTGARMGCAVSCTHTVTFQVAKPGCFQFPGAAHAGQVEVADIAIPVDWEPSDPATYLLNGAFVRRLLPGRPADGHKGTFGHLLAICGSAGMGGSALLAGLAGLKVGTGLVTVGVPRCLRDGFLGAAPELMTLSCEEGGENAFEAVQGEFFLRAAGTRNAVALGCGVGQEEETRAFVHRMVEGVEGPLLIDADGLNALDAARLRARRAPTVITPHPGELVRLSGLAKEALVADRVGEARRLAADWGVVLVLKGAGTVVAAPTGEVFINPTGDPALATAGTGDVLSGMIGGLLAQHLPPLSAALAGVFLHGLARECRREELAEAFFSARDLIEGINGALKALPAD
jgi:NAD(P)H-hydrate epimerase